MGLFNKMQSRYTAMKIGQNIMGEGLGFKAASPGRSSMLSELSKMLQPRYSEPPQRDINDWLHLFATSPRLDPVHKIAEDVASADWALFKKKKDGEKEQIQEHELISLLKKPNPLPETTWFTLLYMTEAYLQLAGEAFWVVERNGFNKVTEFWMIPPNWVASTPTENEDYYQVVTHDGIVLYIDPEDMIYFKEPNLLNPYGRGRGRARAIEDEVETDEYMAKYSKRFFYNDAKPPLVIEAPGAGRNDVDRLEEGWMQKFGGLNNAHKPAFLPFKDAKIHQLASTAREMDFVESRKYLRDQANQHFRVPPELMGIIENSNRATIDAADYIFRSSVLINRLTMIQEVIQHQIIDRFFANENIFFEFENVVPEDKEFELKKANEGLKSGAITVDEWRQKNGYDPLPNGGGAVFLIPNTHTPVKAHLDAQELMKPQEPAVPEQEEEEQQEEEQLEETPKKPEKEEEDDKEKKSLVPFNVLKDLEGTNWKKDGFSEAQRASIGTAFNFALEEIEKEHAKVIQKFLVEQGKRFAKHVENSEVKQFITIVETKADEDDSDEQEQADEILNEYDWIDEQGMLHEAMGPLLLKAAQVGNNVANTLFSLGISFDLFRSEMLHYIETVGLTKVVGITNTTIKLLRKQLIEGIKLGEGSVKLASRIREASSEYAYRRSFVIARTESHSTMVKGTQMTYDQANVPKKEWLSIMDGRERESHHNINGEIVNQDEKFSNGLEFPGDQNGPAEEVIQCRCQLLPKW